VIAPVLAPLPLRLLARGLAASVVPSFAPDALSGSLETMFGDAAACGYNSGRAALAEAFRLAMRATGRKRVVLPAYTSYSVAAAAIAAGAEPLLCDVDPATLALDPDALRRCADERTAAVVLGNLFGWPEPTTALSGLEALGIAVIDDAAQALGAREGGRLAGGRAGLGVLSFGRGKCVSYGDGGVLLIRDPALRAIAPAPLAGARGLREWALALAVSVSRSRLALGCLARLPGVRLGESHFEPVFPSAGVPSSVRAMAVDMAGAAERVRVVRRGVAAVWQEGLAGSGSLRLPPEPAGAEPAWLRYPVLAPSRERREALVMALARAGFQHVRSYPLPLGGIPEFAARLAERPRTPGADELAARVIALPCHQGIRRRDIERAARVLP